MNHIPIYGNELPAFCSKPGDTADPDAVIDCEICQERILRKETAEDERAKFEHFLAVQQEMTS